MNFSSLRAPNKSVHYRNDNTLLFKSLFSIRQMIGAGLLFSLVIPRPLVAALAALTLVPSLVSFVGRLVGIWSEDDRRALLVGRRAAIIKGDFVVFLIGIRPSNTFKLTNNFKLAGEAMESMLKELENRPELGCLGTESYIGSGADGSRTLLVQYWRSIDALNKYASSSNNNHFSPWKKFLKICKESDEIGIWHETYKVQDGEYEAIYVNCPTFGLAACRGADVLTASSHLLTMKGRLNNAKAEKRSIDGDWPEGIQEMANY